jgi:serine/threonine protein kinase
MTDNITGAHPAGTILGSRFRVEKTLGRGGFAITYLCRAGEYDKAFAVKEFLPISLAARGTDGVVRALSEDEQEMFGRGLEDFIEEGRRLIKCRHPNVVQVEDFFEEYGTAYLVMECVEGTTLGQRIGKDGALDAPQLVSVLLPVLDALKVVHDAGLLHRDLTPSNIMLRGGELTSPVLIDFGAARHANAIRSYSIAQVCSDGYSPPEQYDFRGKQGPYSDIYALGCIAYRCLTGARTPLAIDRLTQETDPVDGWAGRYPELKGKLLVPIISKSIAVDPTARQQSAEELRREFEVVRNVWAEVDRLKASDLTKEIVCNERADGTLELSGTVGSEDVASTVISALRAASPGLRIEDRLETRTRPSDARRAAASRGGVIDPTEVVTHLANAAPDATQVMASPTVPMARGAAKASNGPVVLPKTKTKYGSWSVAIMAMAACLVAAIALGTVLRSITWTKAGVPGPKEQITTYKTPPTSTTQPENPFQVQIELPRTRFQIGDSFSFTVTANKDCHFLVYTVSANDKVELHDPKVSGAFMGDPLLKAGERREIPVSGSPGRARINPPSGPYQIGAVCSRSDLEKLGISETLLRRPAQEGKRSFTFTIEQLLNRIKRDELARATVTYDVE